MSTTVAQVLSYAEQNTQAASGTINNSTTGLNWLNDALLDYRTELMRRGVDADQIVEAYVPSVTPPTGGQGSTFSWPADFYFLKTIEVNMINTNQASYLQAQILAIQNTPNQTSFDWYRINQPTDAPLFDNRGDTYEIFPTFTSSMNLVNPIHLFYFQQPTPYSSTGQNLSYPDSLDPNILGLRVRSLYFQSIKKFNEADFWEGKYKERLEKQINTLSRKSQQPNNTTPIQNSGWSY
jgi:hypothetical protein